MTANTSETKEREFVSPSLSDGSTPEIVVIGEDDIADIIREYIADAGYDVTPISDMDAYMNSTATDRSPELVVRGVTRLMLKGGRLNLEQQLERDDVPVLAISGPTFTEAQVEHTDANIVGWVTKPFGSEDLIQEVEAAIKRGAESSSVVDASVSDSSGENNIARSTVERSSSTTRSNDHDQGAGSPDPTANTEQKKIKQGKPAETTPDSKTELQSTPARTDELEAAFDRIQKLETKQRGASEDIAALTEQFSEISKAQTTVSERLDDLDNHVTEINGRTNTIENDVDEIKQTIETLSEGLDMLADEQSRLINTVETATREQAKLRSTVDTLVEWRDDVSVAFNALQVEE